MQLRVAYFGLVKRATGCREETLDLPEGTRLRDLIAALTDRHGSRFRDLMVEPDGALKAEAAVLVDGRNVMPAGGLETVLPPAGPTEIILLGPGVNGGSR